MCLIEMKGGVNVFELVMALVFGGDDGGEW